MLIFAPVLKKGPVAEWLGRALQKLLQRFESARDLGKGDNRKVVPFFISAKIIDPQLFKYSSPGNGHRETDIFIKYTVKTWVFDRAVSFYLLKQDLPETGFRYGIQFCQ